MDDTMLKLSEVRHAAFLDELEKIAASGALSQVELELLKEAFGFGDIRRGLNTAVAGAGNALAQRGLTGTGKIVGALTKPIETGAAGAALQEAGHHFTSTAAPGAMGGFRHGLGEVLHHKGTALAGGGMPAVGRAAWMMANPVGNAAETALTSGGHAASRAIGLNPSGVGHKVLTKGIPRAAEIGGAAGLGAAVGAPVGAAGLLGHGVMGALGHAAPAAAELAGHAAHGLGEAGAEFAHHVSADALGTHGGGVMSRIRGMLPSRAKATQAVQAVA